MLLFVVLCFLQAHLVMAVSAGSTNLTTTFYTTTVVSGYWRVRNKHSKKEFSRWFDNSLKLNAPYVFFYEEDEVMSLIAHYRHGLPTQFVKRSIADFDVQRLYHPSWTNKVHVPSAELGKIWLEKVFCIRSAAKLNFFRTEWFAWVDAGIAAYRDVVMPSVRWPPDVASLPQKQIIYTHVSDGAYHHFAGTAFMYHASLVSRITLLFTAAINTCAHTVNDWRCGNDQYIFTQILEENPTLFRRVGDGYGDVVRILFNQSESTYQRRRSPHQRFHRFQWPRLAGRAQRQTT